MPPVRFDNVTVKLGGRVVLDQVSFTCGAGQWIVLVGTSGCGKTTLLRTVNGLVVPSRGTAWTLGTPIPGRSTRQAREVWRQTGTVLQDIALFDSRSVRANVAMGARAAGHSRRTALMNTSAWLERLGLGGMERNRPSELSGGQSQRVALARALLARPRLLILDEPTSALDRTTARTVLDAIAELTHTGSAVIMSSHRVDEVDAMCDQVLNLGDHRTSPAVQPPIPVD